MKIALKIFFLFSLISSSLLLIPAFSGPVMAQAEDNSWTLPINISKSGANTSPILLVDSNGGFHAIWRDTYGEKWIYSGGDGNNWSNPEVADFPFPYEKKLLRLITDGQGKIHSFWTDARNNLYYSRVNAEDVTQPSLWTSPQLLDIAVIGFDIAVDKNNDLHFAYMRGESPNDTKAGVYYLSYRNGSTNWGEITEIDSSAYLRTISPEDSNIEIAIAENQDDQTTIYIAWNNQPRSKLLVVNSQDTGVTWGNPTEIVGPSPAYGVELPFDISIEANKNNVMILWKLGESKTSCSQRYIWSSDYGANWDEQKVLFEKQDGCPKESYLFTTDQGEFILFTFINDQPYFVAWDGSSWSDPQPQNDFVSFTDPETYRTLNLKCRNATYDVKSFYFVGCDVDISGDIWITSRSIDSTASWFPSPSTWGSPDPLTNPKQQISSMVSVADDAYNHLFWVQSDWSDTKADNSTIYYARWDGNQWSIPTSIISDGIPTQLSVSSGNQGKLILTWVNQQNGDLMFSWADADRANFSVEWALPMILPTPSNIVTFPDILTDSMGKIIITFAVPLNENRGIYYIESSDGGTTWSGPYNIVNAIKEGWDSVDQPKISLSSDGVLHLLFTQYSIENYELKAKILYYSRSSNGGASWSSPEIVNEGNIQWSDLIVSDEVIHRIWQEKNELVVFNNDQISLDNGLTWMRKNTISGSNTGQGNSVTATLSHDGYLHFVQLVNSDNVFLLQDWSWDGSNWISEESAELTNQEIGSDNTQASISAGITLNGNMSVAVLVHYQFQVGEDQNIISTIDRILDEPKPDFQPALTQILDRDPTIEPSVPQEQPEIISPTNVISENVTIQPTSTISGPTPTYDAPAHANKNIVGIILVIALLVISIFAFILWNRINARNNQN